MRISTKPSLDQLFPYHLLLTNLLDITNTLKADRTWVLIAGCNLGWPRTALFKNAEMEMDWQ